MSPPRNYYEFNSAKALRSIRKGIAESEEMAAAQRALRWLYPELPQDKLVAGRLAEVLMFMVLRGYEGEMRSALRQLSTPLARLVQDAEALRVGVAVQGRSLPGREHDVRMLRQAVEQLVTLEEHVRGSLGSDPGYATLLRIELEKNLHSRGAGRRATPLVRPLVATVTGTAQAFPQALDELRLTLARSGLTFESVLHTRTLPAVLRQAAHNLYIAAGENIKVAVQQALLVGGASADAMVIALLWAEGYIAPGRFSDYEPGGVHQRIITGLEFELMGQARPYSWNGNLGPRSIKGTVGVDGIRNGFLVDAKYAGVPVEFRPDVTGSPPRRTSATEGVDPDVYTAITQRLEAWESRSGRSGRIVSAEAKASALERQDEAIDQMRRQLNLAREVGLRGSQWVTNDFEVAEAIRRMAERAIPESERQGLQILVTVGGLP